MKSITVKRVIISLCFALAVAIVAGISGHLLIVSLWSSLAESPCPKGALWLGILLLTADSVGTVLLVTRFKILRPSGAVLAILAGLVTGAGITVARSVVIIRTCYDIGLQRSERTPHALVKQQELIETFRGKGVIAHETYSRVVSVMRREMSA